MRRECKTHTTLTRTYILRHIYTQGSQHQVRGREACGKAQSYTYLQVGDLPLQGATFLLQEAPGVQGSPEQEPQAPVRTYLQLGLSLQPDQAPSSPSFLSWLFPLQPGCCPSFDFRPLPVSFGEKMSSCSPGSSKPAGTILSSALYKRICDSCPVTALSLLPLAHPSIRLKSV